jgi:hypothetical protein
VSGKENNMSILNTVFAFPAGFVAPAVAVARPLFGAGALMTFFMMFKPLITGVLQAVKLVFSPRLSLEERRQRQTLRRVSMLHRLAREFDHYEPSQAAELRMLASRD